MVFVLAYYIIFCFVLLLLLRSSDELGELEGGETVIKIYCTRKELIKKRKKKPTTLT